MLCCLFSFRFDLKNETSSLVLKCGLKAVEAAAVKKLRNVSSRGKIESPAVDGETLVKRQMG